jgi:2-hydroxy-6-oxonona-2,4-dienedioate hydrolase
MVPTLVITACDDGYGTFGGAEFTAKTIRGARFIGFQTGGHLLVGHQNEVFDEAVRLLCSAGLAEANKSMVQNLP